MKRPIDPNLNGTNDELFPNGELGNSALGSDNSVGDEIADMLIFDKEPDKPENTKSSSSEFELTDSDHIGKTRHSSHRHSSGEHSEHHHHGEHSHHSSHHHSSHHHHHHHHHGKHSKKKRLPLPVRILAVFLAVFVVIAAVTGLTFYSLKVTGEKDIKTVTTDTSGDYKEVITYNGHKYQLNENVISVAFLGVDRRQMKDSSTTDFVGSSDADIVVAVDTSTGKSDIIAIPRDTMVDVAQYDENGEYKKTGKVQLCLAYAYGNGGENSCKNVTSSISRILYNVPIDKYYALDLDGIKPLNDAVGGVTVTSLYNLPKYNVKVGDKVTLRGDMAEAYVRTRDMDTINASLNRTSRQMQYVKAFASQVQEAVKGDFSTVSKLYNTAADYSQTNLTLNNMTYVASLLLSKNIRTFDTHSIKGEMKEAKTTEYPDAVYAEFYPDEDALMKTVLDIYYTQID